MVLAPRGHFVFTKLAHMSFGAAKLFLLPWSIAWLSVGDAADFTVSTTNDIGPNSLRQAILDANANPGPDRIRFNIPGDGVQTIRPATVLPPVTEALVLDGYSQPGARPNTLSNGFNGELRIQLDGLGARSTGLDVTGGRTAIRGLVLNRFIVALNLQSSSNVVAGNFVGLHPNGLSGLGNLEGVLVGSNSCCNTVGGMRPEDRNILSGNGGHALVVSDSSPTAPFPPATNTSVLGNFFNTDVSGLRRVSEGNSTTISVHSTVDFVFGGIEPGARNVVASGLNGLHLYPGQLNARVIGNLFGLGVDGMTALNTPTNSTAIWSLTPAWVEGNRIGYWNEGVKVQPGATNVALRRNEIFANQAAAIALGDAALSNDVADLDSGPNDLQNFPVLDPYWDGDTWVLAGRLESRTVMTYLVELFANRSRDSGRYGQGEHYLTSLEVTTSAAGEATFEVQLPSPGEPWGWGSGTATDPFGNTSIFAPSTPVRSRAAPRVHTSPESRVVRPGTNITFQAEASGAAPLFYQWRWNGTNILNATTPSLVLTNVQLPNRGLYTLEISNALGRVETEPARLTVLSAPLFLQSPLSQTVVSGQWVTLSVEMSDYTTPPLGFRWRSNTVLVASSGPGSNFVSFFTFQAGSNSANYSVLVTNQLSPLGILSSVAALTVASDRDHDGLPDAYESGVGLDPDDPSDASGDLDGDGVGNLQEYLSGTDPQDRQSFLKVESLRRETGGSVLTVALASNKTCRVEYQDALRSGQWFTVTNLPARRTNRVESVTHYGAPPQRFYRLSAP
jgi:hypothetical protein